MHWVFDSDALWGVHDLLQFLHLYGWCVAAAPLMVSQQQHRVEQK